MDTERIEFDWLSIFDSDEARLIALAMVLVAGVAAAVVRPVVQAWIEDRRHQREYDLERRKLDHLIERQRRERAGEDQAELFDGDRG